MSMGVKPPEKMADREQPCVDDCNEFLGGWEAGFSRVGRNKETGRFPYTAALPAAPGEPFQPVQHYGRIRLTTVGRPRRLRVRLTQCGHSCSYCGFDAAASLTQSGQKNAMSASRPVDDCGRLQLNPASQPPRNSLQSSTQGCTLSAIFSGGF